jgi:adenylylsulfate kinase
MNIIICGHPTSGKTSIATKFKQNLEKERKEFKIVHSDQFKRNAYKRMLNAVKDGGNWIIDGTFYKNKWIKKFEELRNVKVVLVKASLETCCKRNRERIDRIEEKAVKIIWNEFEPIEADLTIDVDPVRRRSG